MKIKKKDTFGIIDSQEEKEKISYCSRCLKFNFISVLGERIYLPNQPIASDHDLWKQCHECGTIAPIYEAKKEWMIKDFIETTDNPYDHAQGQVYGVENRQTQTQKRKRRAATGRGVRRHRSKRFSQKEKIDPDIANERGTLNIIYDSSR
jgi:hypothetical protein